VDRSPHVDPRRLTRTVRRRCGTRRIVEILTT